MDTRAVGLLLNSAYLAAGTVAVSLPLGVFMAVLLVKTDFPGRAVVSAILAAMLFVPLFAVAAAWEAGFGLSGWFFWLGQAAAGGPAGGFVEPVLDGWQGAILVHGLAAVPWVALIVGIGLRAVEAELEEDALLDAGTSAVLRRVSLRRAAPSVAVAAAWVAAMAAGEMTVTDLFRIRTFAEEVYVQAAAGPLLEPPGDSTETAVSDAAIFWVGCGLVGLLFVVAVLACRRLISDARFAAMRSIRRWPLGPWKWSAIAVTWVILLLIFGVPLGNLVYKAGLHTVLPPTFSPSSEDKRGGFELGSQAAAGPQRHWSLVSTVSRIAASPSEHGRELAASCEIGATAAIAATSAAILLAWWARRGGWRLAVVLAITAICLMTPGPVLGVATIWCLNRPPDSPCAFLAWLYDYTWFAPWLVQTIRAMPLAVLLLWPALASVPRVTLDAAKSEGAGSLRRLVSVALPQRPVAVALAIVICLAVALGELAATNLVYPPGITPISVRSFNMLHSGVDDRLAALVLLMFLSALIFGIAAVVAWRHTIRRGELGGR